MSDPKQQTETWPLWGRVVFWAVLAVILIVAAVVAFHGKNQAAAVRITVSVVVAPVVVVAIVALIKRLTR